MHRRRHRRTCLQQRNVTPVIPRQRYGRAQRLRIQRRRPVPVQRVTLQVVHLECLRRQHTFRPPRSATRVTKTTPRLSRR